MNNAQVLSKHVNGNALVTIWEDGTRTIVIDGESTDMRLATPLNVDVRISTTCSFGSDENGVPSSVCSFCHESASQRGANANLEATASVLCELPRGTEIALGLNHWGNDGLFPFLSTLRDHGLIVNVTVNSHHLARDWYNLRSAIKADLVKGIGVSYRPDMSKACWSALNDLLCATPNVVLHVIAGIDSVDPILALDHFGVNKILVLGEKHVGFNANKVIPIRDSAEPAPVNRSTTYEWVTRLHEVLAKFDIVSFDNLAVEQINVRRFFKDKAQWKTFYQGEHSVYIDAVAQIIKRSSRSTGKSLPMQNIAAAYQQLVNEKEST